jgi:predicted lipoprotein
LAPTKAIIKDCKERIVVAPKGIITTLAPRFGAALALLATLGGCKVLTLEQDRRMREQAQGGFNASTLVDGMWQGKVVPALTTAAVPLAALAGQAKAGSLDAYGAQHGRRSSSEAPWVFMVSGGGRVVSIDRQSRAGVMVVDVAGVGPVSVALGPVVLSTGLRDSLKFLSFADLPDQLAYGAVAGALNDHALRAVTPVAAHLNPGAQVDFIGATQVPTEGEAWQVMPLRVVGA